MTAPLDPDVPENEASTGSYRERDDSHAAILVRLSPARRVIRCRDGLPWILQRRTARKDGWRGVRTPRTRGGLIASRARVLAPLDAGQLAALLRLAARFGG